jgi:ELP3 family radical SAM enzyme/protein acetyltransferase
MAACKQFANKVQDLEDLIRDDDRFQKLKTNYDIYKQIVFDIFDWAIQNRNTPNLKAKFNIHFSKFQRKYRVTVTKALLVFVFKKLISEKEIPNEPLMWKLLRKRPTRNMSGVDVITILMHPYPNGQKFTCEHDCYYCPNEPATKENGYLPPPRSYLSDEPAVARGLRNKYDELDQINERITTLIKNGHEADKLEYIIEGGTHSEFPMDYLESFHRNIMYAANVYYDVDKRQPQTVEEEIEINKTAKVKVIGLSVETRPDNIVNRPEWLEHYRRWGVTRIQLGAQSIYNDVLKKINRGHTVETTIRAIEMCRMYGFKVELHIMLDLPGTTPRKDINMLQEVFQSSDFSPDYIKLYPCSVTPWTVIQEWFHSGKYNPYANKKELAPGELGMIDVVKSGLLDCMPYTRISRVVRDIPTTYIEGGNDFPNLRQLVEKQLENEDEQIWDIRYRECGRHPDYKLEDAEYVTRSFETSHGIEYFISLESLDKKVIFGFIRVRINDDSVTTTFDCLKNKAIVRELHVYGDLVPVGAEKRADAQHRGIGKTLVKMAEELSMKYCQDGVAIISGVGVRGYYEKLGYTLEETYMVKNFKNILTNTGNQNDFKEDMSYLVMLSTMLVGIVSLIYATVPSEFIEEYFKNESQCI